MEIGDYCKRNNIPSYYLKIWIRGHLSKTIKDSEKLNNVYIRLWGGRYQYHYGPDERTKFVKTYLDELHKNPRLKEAEFVKKHNLNLHSHQFGYWLSDYKLQSRMHSNEHKK